MSKYSGFVFDIDKTAVPNGALTVESEALKDAFAALPEEVIAIAATGRSLEFALPITQALNLKHESVVANGALIVDSQTGASSWERLLSASQVASILEVCRPHDYGLYLSGDEPGSIRAASEQSVRITAAAFLTKVPAKVAHDVHAQILEIPGVSAYLSPAWGGAEDTFDINMGNIEAKKHNALNVLYGKYAINASKMIGVGDGLNDLELFEAVGYKIAVANAHPLLIEQADEVVSSQEDDGLAEVVRRFL